MSDLLKNLADRGLTLPTPPKPIASYVPAQISGSLLFISGQLPMAEGRLLAEGPVPDTIDVQTAREAAGCCVLNGLAAAGQALDGQLDRLEKAVRVGVFVQSRPGFTDQALVANGASDLLLDLMGEAGRHARAAVGVCALPLNASVEVEFCFQIR